MMKYLKAIAVIFLCSMFYVHCAPAQAQDSAAVADSLARVAASQAIAAAKGFNLPWWYLPLIIGGVFANYIRRFATGQVTTLKTLPLFFAGLVHYFTEAGTRVATAASALLSISAFLWVAQYVPQYVDAYTPIGCVIAALCGYFGDTFNSVKSLLTDTGRLQAKGA